MSLKLKLLAAPALALTCMSAMAAEDAELKIVGTIVPAPCELTFPGGGKVDLGKIDADTLSLTDFTLLPPQSIGFKITCDAPMAAGVRFWDNRRPAIHPVGIVSALRTVEEATYAFVPLTRKKIGAYSLFSDSLIADGVAVEHISNQFNGAWFRRNNAFAYFNGVTGFYHGFAAPGTSTPIAFTELTGNIVVQAALNKGNDLNLKNEMFMDGSTTVRISYY